MRSRQRFRPPSSSACCPTPRRPSAAPCSHPRVDAVINVKTPCTEPVRRVVGTTEDGTQFTQNVSEAQQAAAVLPAVTPEQPAVQGSGMSAAMTSRTSSMQAFRCCQAPAMTSACLQKLERGWARGMLDENAVAPNCCGPPKATQTARHLAPVQWDPLRGPHLALLISFASRFGLRLSGFARTAPGPQGWRQTTCGVVGAFAHL